MGLNNILEKVQFLLEASKNKTDSPDVISTIDSLTIEHTDDMITGRFFGYSVSDYAIAALKWIGTTESEKLYSEKYEKLSDKRKKDIENLVSKKLYLEL